MYIVLESALGMICDAPEAYLGQPGFESLKRVPATWDETRVIVAVPGKYITIARRKGFDWYIGAITNSEGRNLTLI
ncbi:glycoside hydrolase family 97 C-terminal domain-containing protein [Mucilaginibacter ginkgonis]|nr:glycoside hydrolase family 97 C-terminal domain-containing protein [Mucilaginibacter ginkgonis]